MMRIWGWIVIAAVMLANSQTAQAQYWAKFFNWTINRSEAGCGMTSSPPEAPFALSETLDSTALFRFPISSGKLRPGQDFALIIDSPATEYRPAETHRIEGETTVGPDGKSGEILTKTSLVLILDDVTMVPIVDRTTGKKLGAIDIRGMYDVLQVMRRCVLELRRGGNRGSEKPAVTPPDPRGNKFNWFTADDYPAKALRQDASGTSMVSMTVSADGRVSGCSVVITSGNGHLDEAACRIVSRRARFTPATDEDGAATEGVFTYPVRWVLPE